MTETKTKPRGGRPRHKRIEVSVTPEEYIEIRDRAEQSGLSLSAYLRVTGLNHPIRSVLDLQAVADLSKVNGDLGRVAGLLKLWLAEKRGQGAKPIDVERMMNDFRGLQRKVLEIMSKVVK